METIDSHASATEININTIVGREGEANKLKEILQGFDANRTNMQAKKGIYVYGNPGVGKTTFVLQVLKEMDYDVVKYDAGDIRNKSVIDTITRHNMSDKNIMSLFHRKVRKIVILMDEIDGMNNGDKGGINALIKLIRPKKTKKQKGEEITMNPIICIGNYHVDKRIKELMKVCFTIELHTPTPQQMGAIVFHSMPDLDTAMLVEMVGFVQGDLRKWSNMLAIYKSNKAILFSDAFRDLFQRKSHNVDTKKITRKLLNEPFPLSQHSTLMNETDRTIVGLLWHENIIDMIAPMKEKAVSFYIKQLDNMCFSDYIDRITFQKQIWQFNEMSSLIKTFKNNKMYHDECKDLNVEKTLDEIRFTKVLTKYSTEYNNSTFIQNLCQQLGMDKKDMFAFFYSMKQKSEEPEWGTLFENYEISKLDIQRIYRYLEKYTCPDVLSKAADEGDDEELLEKMMEQEE